MYDVDELIQGCRDALHEAEPRLAVREVLERAVESPADLAAAFGEPAAGLNVLHNAPDLTILNVVWPPAMCLWPHDHRMWAAIAIYGGREDNTFYRRDGTHIVEAGGKTLRDGEILLLGDDAIHGVMNPEREYTGAIHVYGGDFIAKPRSQWNRETLDEEPYDLDVVMAEFARAEEAARAER